MTGIMMMVGSVMTLLEAEWEPMMIDHDDDGRSQRPAYLLPRLLNVASIKRIWSMIQSNDGASPKIIGRIAK